MRWLWIPLTLLAAVIAWLGSGVALAVALVLLGLFIRFALWMRRFRRSMRIGVYTALALAVLAVLVFFSLPRFEAIGPATRVPAQCSVSTELSASRRLITLQTSHAIVVPQSAAVDLPGWQSSTASNGGWRLETVSPPQSFPVEPWSAVTAVTLPLPVVRWRDQSGDKQLVFDSLQVRLRAPQDTVAATTPAASPPRPITRQRVEYAIAASPGDREVEIEVLHPLLRNAFGVWIRGLSIATASKWLAGIILGLLASGIGGWLKRIVTPKPPQKRQAGFKPDGE
jgi:hypothetical protein